MLPRLPWLLACSLLGFVAAPALAQDDLCHDVEDCHAKARAFAAEGNDNDAIAAYAAQVDFATGAGDDDGVLDALLSLTAINVKIGKPRLAYAWAQAALIQSDKTPAAVANLEMARQALAKTPVPGIEGTWSSYAGYGFWSEMSVRGLGGGELELDWFLLRFDTVPSAAQYGPAAMWDLIAKGKYANGTLTVTYNGSNSTDCEFRFTKSGFRLDWVAPKPDEIPQPCLIGGAGALPFGPFWFTSPVDQ